MSSRNPSHRFHACDFPALESLHLSRWLMTQELASPAADNEDWRDFGDKEETWLREFAKTAVAKRAALTRILVDFSPDARGCR